MDGRVFLVIAYYQLSQMNAPPRTYIYRMHPRIVLLNYIPCYPTDGWTRFFGHCIDPTNLAKRMRHRARAYIGYTHSVALPKYIP